MLILQIDVDMLIKRFLWDNFSEPIVRTYVNKFVDPYLEGERPVTQQKAKVGLMPEGFPAPNPYNSLGSHLNCKEPLLHYLASALCEYTRGCITLGPEVIM